MRIATAPIAAAPLFGLVVGVHHPAQDEPPQMIALAICDSGCTEQNYHKDSCWNIGHSAKPRDVLHEVLSRFVATVDCIAADITKWAK